MPKANRRVYQFARLAKRPESEVISVARGAGIEVRSGNDLIPSDRVDLLDKLLGIDRWAIPSTAGVRKRTFGEQQPESVLESEEAVVVAPSPPSEPAVVVPKPRLPKWPTVGQPTDRLLAITPDQVEQIHWILVEDFKKSKDPIEPPGVRSRDLLESAVHRTQNSSWK